MAKSRVLHLQTLKDHDACADQVYLFQHVFGESVHVTPALCAKHAQTFDWHWARRFLSVPARKAYDKACAQARKAYDKACVPAREAYNKACAPAWEAYNKACAPAREAYDKACAPARKAYNKACAPARKAYNKACASAWGRAYINDTTRKGRS